jgi:hypothetical protein
MLPPLQMPSGDAAGGWSASALDVIRFLTALDGTRTKPLLGEKMMKEMLGRPPAPLKLQPDGTWVGLGWDRVVTAGEQFAVFKDGNYYGTRTFMKRLGTGVCWVLLFNVSMQPDPLDARIGQSAVQEVRELITRHEKYPKIDLFAEYR